MSNFIVVNNNIILIGVYPKQGELYVLFDNKRWIKNRDPYHNDYMKAWPNVQRRKILAEFPIPKS